ncbi:MAG: DHH family phosphoesterase [Oscillospiraceae bacterium]|nr:DHH family phosphoesterase [Oscillospiraceae bacterium]
MTVSETAALLLRQNNILILSHIRPDGDTIGCAAGLCALLRQAGLRAYALPNPGVTGTFSSYLLPYLAPESFSPSFIVSVDIASLSLLQVNARGLSGQIGLAIDHHPTYEGFAEASCVDPSCAACGELIYRIALELGGLTRETALPLYVAISTDTGCFQFSNTTGETHRIAAALMDTGIDYQALNKALFRTKSLRRLQIEARLTQTIEFHEDGAIAIASIPLSLMDRLGATEADVEEISNFPGQIAGVLAAITIREQKDGTSKISARTDPSHINASHVCALLGGGGHAAASGCTVNGSIEAAKRAILGAIAQVRRR